MSLSDSDLPNAERLTHDGGGRHHPEDGNFYPALLPQLSRAGSSISSPYFFIFL